MLTSLLRQPAKNLRIFVLPKRVVYWYVLWGRVMSPGRELWGRRRPKFCLLPQAGQYSGERQNHCLTWLAQDDTSMNLRLDCCGALYRVPFMVALQMLYAHKLTVSCCFIFRFLRIFAGWSDVVCVTSQFRCAVQCCALSQNHTGRHHSSEPTVPCIGPLLSLRCLVPKSCLHKQNRAVCDICIQYPRTISAVTVVSPSASLS